MITAAIFIRVRLLLGGSGGKPLELLKKAAGRGLALT
jgi:hypothetical protein